MRLRTDLRQRVFVDTTRLEWVNSPDSGVTRKLLERDGGEVARATSLVRYAPCSRFARHVHDAGEEFLVLDGVFSDEHGEYPAGTYVRNPPGSSHSPFSREGCTLLVKLRQMWSANEDRLVVDSRLGTWNAGPGRLTERMLLYAAPEGGETVALCRFAPGAEVSDDVHVGGEELFVLDGVLEDEFGRYPAGTWLRQPDGSRHAPFSSEGCTL